MSHIKENLITEYLGKPVKVGMRGEFMNNYGRLEECIVSEIIDDSKIKVSVSRYHNEEIVIDYDKFIKNTYKIGSNPFVEHHWNENIRTVMFDIEGILLHCGVNINDIVHKKSHENIEKFLGVDIPEINLNPYVFNSNGEKEYYQRDFVWTLKDKQLLIDSIYNGLDCGTILLRVHSYEYIKEQAKKGNRELSFNDVVDGKQRLCTLLEFINDGFEDMDGNLFSDLSDWAQNKFRRSLSFTFKLMNEKCSDEDTISAFLNINHRGAEMSVEHINKVKEISKRL